MMAADALADHGVELTSLNFETIQSLGGVLSPSWIEGNPVDVGGDASPDRYARVVEICLAASEIEALLIISGPLCRCRWRRGCRSADRDFTQQEDSRLRRVAGSNGGGPGSGDSEPVGDSNF